MGPNKEAIELAEDLETLSVQIKEWGENPSNFLPSPWRVDEWMIKYRDFYKAQNK